MHENATNQSLLLRKTLTAICLPIIIIIWTIGWTLANIRSPVGSIKSSQKAQRIHHRLTSQVEETEAPNEQEIVA